MFPINCGNINGCHESSVTWFIRRYRHQKNFKKLNKNIFFWMQIPSKNPMLCGDKQDNTYMKINLIFHKTVTFLQK